MKNNFLPVVLIGGVALLLMSKQATGQTVKTNYVGTSGKRGLRNNNPGNIRISSDPWQGKVSPNTDGSFEQFSSMLYGCRAMLKNFIAKITKHGLTTLTEIIGDETWGWAPASDGNDPVKYVASICQQTGLSPNSEISADENYYIPKIAAAMCVVENGQSECQKAGVNVQLFNEAWKIM